jgi:CheY-like chemotaxis protein
MSHQSKTILIVDDDESIRESMRLALEPEGYGVETPANGQELDLMMPVMDGWGFAQLFAVVKKFFIADQMLADRRRA